MMKKLFQGNRTGWIGKQFQVGRYLCTVEDVVAEGGFALVFVVRTPNGQKFALKRLSVNEKADLKVCKQEIEIMKMLSGHKNTITFLDSAINVLQPGIYEVLMLMEMCKGNVIDLMNENLNSGFSEKMVLKMFCDTCEVLALLHSHNPPILHRDLKVENILMKENGDFVLCDFGSATMGAMNTTKDSIRAIEDDILKYTTVSYRSPEMIDLYSGHVIDTKSDIWVKHYQVFIKDKALGCLLFKFCFFAPPFGESTLAIQSGHFSFPENSKYSKELHNLISFILIPDPAKRPDIYQVSQIAFKLAGYSNPPVANFEARSGDLQVNPSNDSQSGKKRKTSVPSQPKSAYTAVAPRERPVATSLAPRQRPKGNNAIIEADGNDGAMPFKHPNVENIKKGSSLRRSHSLKETSNQTSVSDSQLHVNPVTSFQSEIGIQNDAVMIGKPYAQVQTQDILAQQREIYLHQQFIQQQQIQYLHHQEYLRQQQQHYEYLQQQHNLQKQREIIIYQQELELRSRQQQHILRQRQEEYSRLQNLHDNEQLNNQNALLESNVSSTPFSDDFSHSSPNLQNPFLKNVVDGISTSEKKKTHNRSQSEIIGKSASGKDSVESVVKTPNPFLSPVTFQENIITDNAKSQAKMQDVGVLLEIDDDEHFLRLQKEFLELGVNDAANNILTDKYGLTASTSDPPLISSNSPSLVMKKYHYERTSSCSSDSDVESSEGSDVIETKYTDLNLHDHSADAEIVNMNEYEKESYAETFQSTKMKDVFDSAPFLVSDTSKLGRNFRGKDLKLEIKSAKLNNETNTGDSVFAESPGTHFADQFSSSIRIATKKTCDLFGMSPLEKVKTPDATIQNFHNDNPFKTVSTNLNVEINKNPDSRKPPIKTSDDPFGCAPFVKSTKSSRLNPNTGLQTKLPNKNRQLPSIPLNEQNGR